jgi:hypothetical protein
MKLSPLAPDGAPTNSTFQVYLKFHDQKTIPLPIFEPNHVVGFLKKSLDNQKRKK